MPGSFVRLRSPKVISRFLAATAIVVIITTWYKAHSWTEKHAVLDHSNLSNTDKTERCLAAEQKNIALIVKTGASEAYNKLPTQFQTALSCAENLLIMSDLDLDFTGHHMYDVLENVNTSVREAHPAFEIYREQLRLRDAGRSMQENK